MKKILFLFSLCLCSIAVWAQDPFYNEAGTLKFTILTETTNVSVAAGTTAPTGDLVIPASVENDGTTYTVTTIGYSAFSGCSGLTSVVIPNSVTSIGTNAFSSCISLTSVTIGNSVTSIGSSAFNSCRNLTSVTIPNSVTSMGTNVFTYCSGLTSVTISNSISTIQDNTFAGCSNLTNVTIPNSVTTIRTSAFEECYSLTSVDIPNSVRTIGNSVFYGCSGLTSVTIGNSVMSIPLDAFNGCSSLTSVTIPNSVRGIMRAFGSCTKLKTVYNFSNVSISTTSYGLNANRVIKPTKSGTGANVLYQIPGTYTFVDSETGVETEIPRSTIPDIDNLIYNDGGWKSNKIVLTDDSSAFNVPVAFTAAEVTYIREFTNGNRSTLYLPFGVAEASIPEGLEVYDFSTFSGSSISFAEHTGGIAAYTPYLVGYDISSKDGNSTKCTFSLSNVTFPQTPTSPAGVTDNGMTFQGTTKRTCMTNTNYGYSNGYFVQSGNGTDHSGHAHVNPFRCYFTYSGSAPMGLPPTLDIDLTNNGLTGIVTPDKPVRQHNIRYSDNVYDTMGRLVRKHAKDLEGLPKGIYIWKGQKVLHFQ